MTNTIAAAPTWAQIAAAEWQLTADNGYTSEAFAGCVLTVAPTSPAAFAAAKHWLANGAVSRATLTLPDGAVAVWYSPWVKGPKSAPHCFE